MVLLLFGSGSYDMKFKHLAITAVATCMLATAAWAVSFTANKGYFLPTVGGDPNVWGGYINQTTTLIDTNLGGTATVNVAGSANITATSTQAQNLVQKLTGTLTDSIKYIVPATGSFYIVNNATTGAFTVTVVTSAVGSTGVVVPQGQSMHVYSDATNIYPANGPSALPTFGQVPVGAGMPYWGTSAPTGWILAFGQSLGTATCPALFTAIGTTYGGSGSNFNAPDMRGRLAIAKDDMGGSAANRITSGVSGITGTTLGSAGGDQHAQADTITTSLSGSVTASSTSTPTDPGHSHTVPSLVINNTGSSNLAAAGVLGISTATTSTSTTGITVATTTTITNTMAASSSSSLTGATQNVQPGIVSNYIIFAGAPCT